MPLSMDERLNILLERLEAMSPDELADKLESYAASPDAQTCEGCMGCCDRETELPL